MAARPTGARGDLAIAALWGASSDIMRFLATAAELVAARLACLQILVHAASCTSRFGVLDFDCG
jgi:hypothetical protein